MGVRGRCVLALLLAGALGRGSGAEEALAALPAWHPRLQHTAQRLAELSSPRLAPRAAAQPPTGASPPPPARVTTGVGEGRWEECDSCQECTLNEPPAGVSLQPGPAKHCTYCYGCNVVLTRLPAHDTVLGKARVVFTGASGAAVLRGQTVNEAVVVKFWCGVPGGYKQNDRANPISPCPAKQPAKCTLKGGLFGQDACNFRFLNSMQRMVDDANLSSITPRTWTQRVRSFLPYDGSPTQGLKLDLDGQLYQRVDGVSIEAFLGGFVHDEALSLLQRIDSESVRLAAAFDFIFSESDRHGQNVFLHPHGALTLIDNEGTGQRGVNSMFLPGTQKYEVYRIGYAAVCCKNLPGNYATNCPGTVTPSSPEALLDYRCHVPGGVFGTKLPPGMAAFVGHVAGISALQLQEEYDMTRLEHAERLKARVDDIAAYGFEEALARQLARQEKGNGELYGQAFSYPVPAPCCSLSACAIRLSKDYRGSLATPGRLKMMPWVNPAYNCRTAPNATVVGGPAQAPLNRWGPDFTGVPVDTTPEPQRL